MKVTVITKDLAKQLSIVTRYASTRAQLPVLSNIKLQAHGTKLLMSATNLEISISAQLGAKVDTEGEIAAPAKVFSDLTNSLSSERVDIEVEGETINVKTDTSNTKINGLNTADFPDIPTELSGEKLEFSVESIKSSFNQVLFSASIDDTRPVLAGVLVIFDNRLTFVASDGFRLSQKSLDSVSKYDARIIIPKATAVEFSKLMSTESGKIEFSYDDTKSQMFFSIGKFLVSSRLIEGEYPNYEKIIPKSHRVQVSVDKTSLKQALKTVSIFARESSNIVKMDVSSDGIAMSSESQKSGAQKSTVPAKVTGGNLTVLFNYKFIEDFLNSISGEDIVIELTDGSSSGVFRDMSDPDYLHLIMPVKN